MGGFWEAGPRAWRLAGDTAADLDETKVDAILSALCTYVSAQATDADPAVYGFEAPLVTAEVTTADGTINLTYAMGTDGCYLMVEGDSSVYTVDASVVSDNYQAGVLVAQRLMKQKNGAKILLLEHKGTVSAEQRIQGFLDTIQSEPAYQVVGREETRGQTELALPAVSQVIQDGLVFDTVVALNDRAAIGALAAIKENQLAMPISIYGIDGSPDMKVLLSTTDDIEGTVAQSPLKMGRQVMQVIECMRTGKSYKEQYKIPVEMIDKDNVDRYDVNGWQ